MSKDNKNYCAECGREIRHKGRCFPCQKNFLMTLATVWLAEDIERKERERGE